jgi:hypothetical protein
MQSQPNTKAPDYGKLYKEGIQTDLQFLPKELSSELAYRQQYSPQFTQQALNLQHQFDPSLANEQLSALQRRDPQWLALHQGLGDKVQQALSRGYIDPQQNAAYQALGKQVTGDTLRGQTMSPDMLHQTTQAILSRSPSLSYGEAQDMAAAVYTGQRGQQLQQQRQQATNQFLSQQTPEMQTYGLAGTYIQPSNSVTGAINQIQGVTAPSALQYVNPNAPSQALQFGLNNFQNQLASGSAGGGNPWTNALSGAATGAQYGSIGGGYGAAGGAVTGATAGLFGYPQYSDQSGKINVTRTGIETPDGVEVVEYDYQGKRWRGVIAQEVQKKRPDAVYHYGNGKLGVFYSRIGIELKEIT